MVDIEKKESWSKRSTTNFFTINCKQKKNYKITIKSTLICIKKNMYCKPLEFHKKRYVEYVEKNQIYFKVLKL